MEGAWLEATGSLSVQFKLVLFQNRMFASDLQHSTFYKNNVLVSVLHVQASWSEPRIYFLKFIQAPQWIIMHYSIKVNFHWFSFHTLNQIMIKLKACPSENNQLAWNEFYCNCCKPWVEINQHFQETVLKLFCKGWLGRN